MSYKHKTNEVLLANYVARGYDHTLDLASKIIASRNLYRKKEGMEARNTIAGEVAETVLEIAVKELIRKFPQQTNGWTYSKGLVLRNPERPDSSFRTEIDFLLVTPVRMYIFECKNYVGEKLLVEQGTIQREGHEPVDVFKQQSVHLEAAHQNFDAFRLNGDNPRGCYQPVGFSFATGSLRDKREKRWRTVFPFLEIKHLMPYLEAGFVGEEVWNVKYVTSAIKNYERNLNRYTAEHLDYVRNLHRK